MANSNRGYQIQRGAFLLDATVTADQVFTREDLSGAQQKFGRIAEDFMRTEVLPREK